MPVVTGTAGDRISWSCTGGGHRRLWRKDTHGTNGRKGTGNRPGRAHPSFPLSVEGHHRGSRERSVAGPRDPRSQSHLGARLVLRPAVPAAPHHLCRQGGVHGRLEDQVPVPGDGNDPDRPIRWRRGQTSARRGSGGARGRRAVRYLSRGHPFTQRQAPQGPHRHRATRPAHGSVHRPGGDHRLRRRPASRRQDARRSAGYTSASGARSMWVVTRTGRTTASCCARSPTR